MNPPAFHNGGGFWFLVWNESGLRPDPGPDVMLLWITLRRLLRKSREPALARMLEQTLPQHESRGNAGRNR